VVLLDHRIADQVSTRRLRIVKHRGTSHGSNKYPFLIEDGGISILPLSSLGLAHQASTQRVSTGVSGLDAMLEGKGYFRGSTVLVSGMAGSGNTSLAAHFVDAACRRGERCLVIAFEESPFQVVRNMRSIGIDLQRWIDQGLLEFHASRPTQFGLESHLVRIHQLVGRHKPRVMVIDPVTTLTSAGTEKQIGAMLIRLIDFLKERQVTVLMTSLISGENSHAPEQSEAGISSLIDTWLMVRDLEVDCERNRGLYVIKSRGMAHSNQVREFLLTDHGVELVTPYLGSGRVLTGSARVAQEAREKADALARHRHIDQARSELEYKRRSLDNQIEVLRAAFASEEGQLQRAISEDEEREAALLRDRAAMARSRRSRLREASDGQKSTNNRPVRVKR
jgi:circadian clock protein KaiC